MDVVAEYIDLKQKKKETEERLSALEVLIFEKDELRADNRIKIVAGRKTITIKEDVYEKLENLGISIKVTEQRYKDLKEFDIDIQEIILTNPENFVEKTTKESIRIV